jgi:hypothetical protein
VLNFVAVATAIAGASATVHHTGELVEEPVRWRTEALLMLLRTTTHFGCCCEVSSLKSPGESKERLRVTKCRGRTDCFAKRENLSRGRTIHRYNSRQHSGGCLSIALIIMRNNSNHKTMMTRYCAHTIGMYVLKYHCPVEDL